MSIVADIDGILQVFSDGSTKRLPIPTAEPSPEFTNGFKTKDVVINSTKPITARIFIPDTPDNTQPLPVLVYFHGGGFCIGSTTFTGFHHFLGKLSVVAQVLIVSVDYRLAPEHRIPAQYDDCYESLQWISKNVEAEPCLERADLSHIFLSGESAGANIVHHVAVRLSREPVDGVNVRGLVVIHPFFGSGERVGIETTDEMKKWVGVSDMYWQLSLPEGADRDHWASNYEKAAEEDIEWGKFAGAVTVFLAEKDLLKERGAIYAEFLEKKGVEVEVVVSEGEAHAFHVYNPESEATSSLQSKIAEFVKKLCV